VLWLRSGADRAAFVGDLLHTPVQVWSRIANPCFDEDQAAARATRRGGAGPGGQRKRLMCPPTSAVPAREVRAEGGGYTISGWAAFQ